MNTNQLINMGMRMFMRYGMKFLSQLGAKSKDDTQQPNANKPQSQSMADAQKRMKNTRRFMR